MSSIYLKLDGIDGNVTAQGLQDYIQLESVDFGVSRKMNTQPGVVSDREGAKPSISEITITKRTDKTTPLFFTESTTGSAKAQALLKFVVNNGKDLNEFLTVTLNNVMVSGFSVNDAMETSDANGGAVEKRPLEKITLNFDKIEVKYTPYDAQNNPGSPIPSGYDLQTAQAC